MIGVILPIIMLHFGIDKKAYRLLLKERRHIDKLMLATGILGPLSAIPQVWAVYSSQDASSLSLVTWVFFFVIALVGFCYSLIHNIKILIVGYFLWLLIYIPMIIGILLY